MRQMTNDERRLVHNYLHQLVQIATYHGPGCTANHILDCEGDCQTNGGDLLDECMNHIGRLREECDDDEM